MRGLEKNFFIKIAYEWLAEHQFKAMVRLMPINKMQFYILLQF